MEFYKKVIIIKKLSVLLAFVILVTVFAGCTNAIDPEQASPFSVYRVKDKLRFTIDDKREDVERIIEDTPGIIFEYDDETPEDQIFELVRYEYISFGYDRAGNVLRLRLYDDTWQIANGLKVTDPVEEIKNKYPEESIFTYNQNNDIYVSYDENGNLIDFSSKSPYLLRFVVEDLAIKEIVILKNINPLF